MCQPNAAPSLCRTLPYGPPFPDFLWTDIDPCPQTEFKSTHGWAGQLRVLTLTWQIACALHRRDEEDCKERKIPFESRVCCDAEVQRKQKSLPQNVVYNGEFWILQELTLVEGWSSSTPQLPQWCLFASKHQTWVGLNTGGRSPAGTKPPWAWPQERQRWLSLTHGGSQGAPKGTLRAQTCNKTSCHCYPRQKSTPLVKRADKGKMKPEQGIFKWFSVMLHLIWSTNVLFYGWWQWVSQKEEKKSKMLFGTIM